MQPGFAGRAGDRGMVECGIAVQDACQHADAQDGKTTSCQGNALAAAQPGTRGLGYGWWRVRGKHLSKAPRRYSALHRSCPKCRGAARMAPAPLLSFRFSFWCFQISFRPA